MVRRQQPSGSAPATENLEQSRSLAGVASEVLATRDSEVLVPRSPAGRKLSLVVLVPAYNEAERIEETLHALRSIEGSCQARGFELSLYVINDGSRDNTGEIALRAGADRVLHHKVNRGPRAVSPRTSKPLIPNSDIACCTTR